MANPGYSLADSSPPEIVEFPVAERPGSSLRGKLGPTAREHTNLEFETEEGVLWIYPQIRRRIFRLIFRVNEYDLEIFETLHQAVDGNRIAFYYYPDVEASPLTSFLVRKARDFDPQQIDTPTYISNVIVPIYDYVLEMREESEAAQLLA